MKANSLYSLELHVQLYTGYKKTVSQDIQTQGPIPTDPINTMQIVSTHPNMLTLAPHCMYRLPLNKVKFSNSCLGIWCCLWLLDIKNIHFVGGVGGVGGRLKLN